MMNWKKRAFSLALCMVMCLSLFPTGALAEELQLPEEEPAAEIVEQPADDAEQPADDTEQPADDTEQPADDAEQPADDTEQPADDSEQPADDAEQPVTETEGLPEDPFVEAEEEPAEEEELDLYVEQDYVNYAPELPEDSDSLLNAYVQKQLDSLRPQGMSIQAVHDTGASLSGVNQTVFYLLKDQIVSVAAGDPNYTKFTIPVTSLGLSKTSWTAAELGLDSLIVYLEDGSATFSEEAMNAVNEQVGFTLREVVSALLADCPFELYWYEKTVGTDFQSYAFSGTAAMIRITGQMTFCFNVADAYSDGSQELLPSGKIVHCGIDPSTGTAVSNAVSNAAGIASDYSGSSDYDKLVGFKNEICNLVSYNSVAAGGGMAYGDPWQIIWVFDRDENTNVVCEGYAKAFQYLCDISNLSASVMAYTVTGVMSGGTGAGAHMWNIVHMDNGKNYLVDVTNCDDGSAGAPDKLFLAGATEGSVDDGYTVVLPGRSINYTYEDKMRAIFSDSELTLSQHTYLDDINDPDPGTVMNLQQLKNEIAAFLESGEAETTVRYPGSSAFVVNESVTIPMGMHFVLPNGTLYVQEGVTLTLALGAVVSTANADVRGTLSVAGTLSMQTSASQLAVSGSLQNSGSVVVLDPAFTRAPTMSASGGRYYVEHYVSDEQQLRAACEIAAADGDTAVVHEIYPRSMIALSADLTLSANVRMRINSGAGISTAEGVTLTNRGEIVSKQSLQLLGTTVNEGELRLMRGVSGSFGPYTGAGQLSVYKESENPFQRLSGLNTEAFSYVQGQNNYWILSIRRFSVSWLNYDDSVLQSDTVEYGGLPAYAGAEPTKPATAQARYTFAGWTPEIVPATEDAVYTAVFTETLLGWHQAEGKWYYYDNDGVMVTGWRTIDGNRYYFNDQGEMQTGFQAIDGSTYYFSAAGVLQTGWLKIAGEWYYFGGSGVMVTGWQTVGGKRYYFEDSGAMATGLTEIEGKTYLFNGDGAIQTGWQEIEGRKYYFGSSGAAVTGWQSVGGKWYLFSGSGVMQTGWHYSGGKWYFMHSDGTMATGWVYDGGKWYYMNGSGQMQTGFQTIGGKRYYFYSSGAMASGWAMIDSSWYYFESSGAMVTGWKQVSGTWYYFDSTGVMATNWRQIGGRWYYFNSSGDMATGWKKINGSWYYFESSGAMLASTSRRINGKTYYFNASGVCTNP